MLIDHQYFNFIKKHEINQICNDKQTKQIKIEINYNHICVGIWERDKKGISSGKQTLFQLKHLLFLVFCILSCVRLDLFLKNTAEYDTSESIWRTL